MSPAGPNGGAPRDVRPPARPSAPRPIRVLLVDDHRLIPESLARVLGAEADIRIVGIAGSVAEAKALANAEPLDVVLMDYRLPDGTGVDATRAIKARWPSARVVMLTGGRRRRDAARVDPGRRRRLPHQGQGARGRRRGRSALAYAGATLLPRSVIVTIARRVAEARDRQAEQLPIEQLTPRELEVLRALTDGLSTPEICQRLYITPNTLRTHVQNIMGKLHVHSKLEAVAFALRHRLVEPPRAE